MSSYLYLFEILLQLLLHFVDGDVEKLHLSGEFRESFFHELLFAGLLNLLLGSSGNKVAQASLVVDNLIGGKQVVCLHGCVGIYLQQYGVFPDARYSFVFLVRARLRRDAGLLHQGLDLVNAIVAGGIQFKDVVGALLVESLAALALVACLAVFARVLAVDCLGKDAGTSGLAHTSRTAEEVGVCQLAALHRILQSGGQSTLSYDRIEGHRTVFSC